MWKRCMAGAEPGFFGEYVLVEMGLSGGMVYGFWLPPGCATDVWS